MRLAALGKARILGAMGSHVVITEAEAERSFPELLRAVKAGQRVTITDGGKAVAEMGPAPAEDEEALRRRREQAWEEMERQWATTEPIVIGPWTRDELYDRD